MSEKIPVNPGVLKWARQTAGFTVSEVAHKMNKDAETIEMWENGEEAPTYIQLETLAYQVYKRPVALFFFPRPPEEETLKQAFRTLPDQEIDKIPPRLYYLLKQARAMQINLEELNESVNPAPHHILHDLKFEPDTPVDLMAARVREYLNLSLTVQVTWKSVDEAFDCWRSILEKHGVYVFKDVFKDEGFSAFCLYHRQFPVIYINNSTAKTRQIFSIFHELAHLLLGTGGVDSRNDAYITYLDGSNKKIEILCNHFAASFLVPDEDFFKRVRGMQVNERSIKDLADTYKVSREVILRRCLDKKLISNDFYSQQIGKWEEAYKSRKDRGKTGGDYYRTRGAYLGEGYLSLVFSRYYQKKISVDQLANYLGMKVKNIPAIESLLLNKG